MKIRITACTHGETYIFGREVGAEPVYWSREHTTAERSPWFPWPTRPVHVGWYEMRGPSLDSGTPMFWNGAQWGYWMPHPASNGHLWVHWADDEKDEWRGLAEKP